MNILSKIITEALLCEGVSNEEVLDALENHKRVIINYHTKGEDKATGARVIEVYAFGLTKAGYPVIRAFEPYGDTTTQVPRWKFFRLDRISAWKPTEQIFTQPASDYMKGLGDFNENGDETMSVVYRVAKFGNQNVNTSDITTNPNNPKTKDELFKTDTEKRIERQKQNLANPINLSDIKTKDAFKTFTQEPTQAGPKTKDDVAKQTPIEPETFRTDTERGMERLKQQLQNPQKIDLSRFDKKPQSNNDNSELITKADLDKRLQQTEPSQANTFKTDTERGMERLRQQLQNPQKIDLSQFDRDRKRK